MEKIIRTIAVLGVLFALVFQAKAWYHPIASFDELRAASLDKIGSGYGIDRRIATDTSRYPLTDRRGDPYTYQNRNSFELQDTSFIKRDIIYDPKTKQYYVVEKIGNQYYRTPVSFSMEEFIRLQG